MSRYFVTDAPIAVPEYEPTETDGDRAPPNIIWIRAKMDVETDAKVKAEMLIEGNDGKLQFRPGLSEMALLVHNIVRWEGPDLSSVPCTPSNIRKLDPTEPHLSRVITEISRRNNRRAPKNPKSAADGTHTMHGDRALKTTRPVAADPAAAPSANGISRSPLPSDSAGPPNRSDD